LAGVDGVVQHSTPPPPFLEFLGLEAVGRVPVVLHVHSFVMGPLDRLGYAGLWGGYRGWPPSRIVTPSQNTAARVALLRASLAPLGFELPPIDVIPHGMDLDEIRGGDRAEGRRLAGAAEGAPLLLSLGRISPRKSDYRQLLLAVMHLIREGRLPSDTRLVIAGGVAPDDRPEELAALAAQLGIAQIVQLRPAISEGDKRHLLAAADLFVSLATNPQESFGLALLEAMALGVPIVATDWDGYPEVLPPAYGPHLVATTASHDLARALRPHEQHLSDACAPRFSDLLVRLERLTGDAALRAELRREGLARAEQCTWSKAAERLVALWEELLAAQRGPARALAEAPRTPACAPRGARRSCRSRASTAGSPSTTAATRARPSSRPARARGRRSAGCRRRSGGPRRAATGSRST
jgi:glycosyltransferase involved in cell wall biosynthesis